MSKEFETQVLEVDVEAVTDKLRKLGAKEKDEILQKRWVFYIDENKWIRLRQAGDSTTITYKSKSGSGISQTEELEVEVEDFDSAEKVLRILEFYKDKYYQENKRKYFEYDEIEFTLDTWPKIPTVLEIEAKSEDKVKAGLGLLGLEGKDIGHEGFEKIYQRYGIELHKIKKLKF